jgi:hypothetical protein
MANRLTKGIGLFGGLVSNGRVSVNGPLGQSTSVANIADGGSMVATAAQVINSRIITATPSEARNLQLPTAASVIALVPANRGSASVLGQTYEFSVINLAGATHALTLTVNTGTTIQGSAVIAAASSGRFGIRIASGTTAVVYRLS